MYKNINTSAKYIVALSNIDNSSGNKILRVTALNETQVFSLEAMVYQCHLPNV